MDHYDSKIASYFVPLEVAGQFGLLSVYRELEGVPGRAAITGMLAVGNYFACSAMSKALYRKTFDTTNNPRIQYSALLRDQALYRSASKSIRELPSPQRDAVRRRVSSVLAKSDRFSTNSQTALLAFLGCKAMFGIMSARSRGDSLFQAASYGISAPTSAIVYDFLKANR